MRIGKNLDEVLGEIERQDLVHVTELPKGRLNSRYNLRGDEQPFLFFPRKKLNVTKNTIGFSESESWMIRDRLDEKTDSLNMDTEKTNEAITSGLRCCLIKDKGKYIKLKGVAPKVNLGIGGKRGICSKHEALNEQLKTLAICASHYVVAEPFYIEASIIPRKQITLNQMREFISGNKVFRFKKKMKIALQYDAFQRFVGSLESNSLRYNLNYVSALRVFGDTRVDEAIYHLTREKFE